MKHEIAAYVLEIIEKRGEKKPISIHDDGDVNVHLNNSYMTATSSCIYQINRHKTNVHVDDNNAHVSKDLAARRLTHDNMVHSHDENANGNL